MSDQNDVAVEVSPGNWQLSYETKDNRGNVVSRTMLTGKSSQEVYSKLVKAHKEASLAVDRIRRHNVQKSTPIQLGNATEETLKLQDARLKALGAQAGYEFMRNHVRDYFPCEANSQILGQTLEAEGLSLTAENLEIAFELCKHRLTSSSARPVETAEPTVEVPAETPAPSPAAGKPWEAIRTKSDVYGIERNQYRAWMNSEAFKLHVNSILSGGGQ